MPAFPKNPRGENRQLLDLARGQDCLLQSPECTHQSDTVVACHPRGVAIGTGGHYKASDELTVWGCYACNVWTDQAKDVTAEEKAELFEAGRRRQIQAWKDIAAGDRKEPRRRAALWALERLGEV